MKEMINTLKILEQLNESRDNSIYTNKEINEEKENINEMKEIYFRLKKVLDELGNISNKEENSIMEQLIDLHLVYSDLVWQYDQMHDMIKKMIRLYR